MTLEELEVLVPELNEYTKNMPSDIRSRCTVIIHPAGSVIHTKNMSLNRFGIVARGENRVINEFENGNVYMIENNSAIDFIGEVTILACMERTSVTIRALTDNYVAYISRKDAERWLDEDINILHLTTRHTARKLYLSSYNNGATLFYPPSYLLLDYITKYGTENGMAGPRPPKTLTINRTRQELQVETGISAKTINRTVRQLKEDGFLTTEKGKIAFSQSQYLKSLTWLKTAKDV